MRSFRRLGPRQFIVAVIVMMVLMIVGICALPHSRYVRFKSLHDIEVVKSGWIYERIHFDSTPTDVVFIGSSHTMFGVDSARIEQQYLAATGHDLHVVNFAMSHLGRDLQYLLAREVLQTRPVKLLVIEVREDESRSMHPAFGSLANTSDIITAPIFINTSYLDNLAHLPLRQLRLFMHSVAPELFGEQVGFNIANYAGSHWDDAYRVHGAPGATTLLTPRLESHTAAELEHERQHLDRMMASKLILPGALKPLETRANLLYLGYMLKAATRAGVRVQFLYMPTYAVRAAPRFQDLYKAHGSTWYPQEIYGHLNWWLDVGHLNYFGAEALSDWLAKALIREQIWKADPAKAADPANCQRQKASGKQHQ
jgi:hypothetical protein